MSLLVIGGGLIGSQIARVLVESGRSPIIYDRSPQPGALGEIVDLSKVTLVQGDILRPWDLAAVLRREKIEGIIHTAAYPMLTAGAQARPYDAIEVNIMGTTNVLEAATTFGIPKVVVVSSAVLTYSMEGGADGGDLGREEAFPRPMTFYAATKQAVEGIALNYARWRSVDVRMVRYAAVAGPWTGQGGGEPTNIFRAMVEDAMRHGKAEVPNVAIEWIYSRDAGRGTVLAYDAKVDKDRVFNLSLGATITPENFVQALKQAFPGVDARVKIGPGMVGAGPDAKSLDMRRSKAVLGYEPEYDMAGALRDYAAWLKPRLK